MRMRAGEWGESERGWGVCWKMRGVHARRRRRSMHSQEDVKRKASSCWPAAELLVPGLQHCGAAQDSDRQLYLRLWDMRRPLRWACHGITGAKHKAHNTQRLRCCHGTRTANITDSSRYVGPHRTRTTITKASRAHVPRGQHVYFGLRDKYASDCCGGGAGSTGIDHVPTHPSTVHSWIPRWRSGGREGDDPV